MLSALWHSCYIATVSDLLEEPCSKSDNAIELVTSCWQLLNRLVSTCLQTCSNLCVFTRVCHPGQVWKTLFSITSLSISVVFCISAFQKAPIYNRHNCNIIFRTSFSRRESKLPISRVFFCSFRVDVLLHRTCHVANPDLLLIFHLENQIRWLCCFGFPKFGLEIPDEFCFIVLQHRSSLISFFVPHPISSNQFIYVCLLDCKYH